MQLNSNDYDQEIEKHIDKMLRTKNNSNNTMGNIGLYTKKSHQSYEKLKQILNSRSIYNSNEQ